MANINTFVLRSAVDRDALSVARVHIEARAAASMPPIIHSDDEVRSWIVRVLTTDTVWVAEREGQVAGYARFSETWLDDLYVLPLHQGTGMGTALLELVKAQRPAGFCLWVFQCNVEAQSFYRRHGLVELEGTDGSGNEEKAPDRRMAWPGADPLMFLGGLVEEVEQQLVALLERRAALARASKVYKSLASSDAALKASRAEVIALKAASLGLQRLQRILDAIDTETADAARNVVDS
jgi:GNAT superfamily N-acetyltransferase